MSPAEKPESPPEVALAARLAASDELFRLLVDSVRDYAIFMLDPAGRIATWNAGAARIKGYTADEVVGRHFSLFYTDLDVRAGKAATEIEIATRTGRFEEEGWRVRKDGTQFWASVVLTALRDASGTLVGFAKVTRDLTERKLAEDLRRAAEERFRLLVESVKDYAIFILDTDGRVATWNAGAERIKGYRAEEIIGSHFSRFYPSAEIEAGKCEYELEVAGRDGRFEDEGWRLRKDGSQFWANVVISAIRDHSGTLVGFSKVTRDLTERRRSEQEHAGRLAAEEANRVKDEFLAMLGHELRNPLAPIVSALQLLKLRGDERSVREHQVIERQVNHMIRLVDDLLDVSRITRGKIVLKRTRFDLRDAVAKAAEIAIPMFERKDQNFEVDAPARALLVDADESRLVQVFSNLFNNAAKFTGTGGRIVVSLRQERLQLVVEVRDNGTGIDAQTLPRVFDLFVQGYQDLDRTEGGLGVGLTLVRALVELHGGTVHVASAGRGKGTTFTVRLPATGPASTEATERHRATVLSPSSGARKILLVDDNEDARVLLEDMLVILGNDVRAARDGTGALHILEEFHPDVAILDIGLPGMDGYELARRIRADRGTSIRLIAVTGYAQQVDQDRSRGAGFDAHLAKPVELSRLIEQLVGAPSVE